MLSGVSLMWHTSFSTHFEIKAKIWGEQPWSLTSGGLVQRPVQPEPSGSQGWDGALNLTEHWGRPMRMWHLYSSSAQAWQNHGGTHPVPWGGAWRWKWKRPSTAAPGTPGVAEADRHVHHCCALLVGDYQSKYLFLTGRYTRSGTKTLQEQLLGCTPQPLSIWKRFWSA